VLPQHRSHSSRAQQQFLSSSVPAVMTEIHWRCQDVNVYFLEPGFSSAVQDSSRKCDPEFFDGAGDSDYISPRTGLGPPPLLPPGCTGHRLGPFVTPKVQRGSYRGTRFHSPGMVTPLLLLLLLLPRGCAAGQLQSECLILCDAVAAQDLKIEAHGDNALRVRAVPTGGSFKDTPDVISALVPPPPDDGNVASVSSLECPTVVLSAAGGQQAVTNGNLKAAVGPDGKLSFTRVSDGKILLTEKAVRALQPTTTTPPVAGFLSLQLSFEAVEGERIYGLGQHAAFSWAKDFPANGQLDQKGVPAMLLEPHDGDVTIPVAHSSLGYAFLSNLPSTGSVEFNATGSFWRHSAVLQMDIWVATTADSPPHAVSPWQQLQSAYVDATGHAPVWPEWTSGFWQCKLRYSNQYVIAT
jgi:hypothetical protein